MLLRASGQAIDAAVEIEGAVGAVVKGDGGVPCGHLLAQFAEAATRGSEELADARAALLAEVGGERFIEAAATVGVFNGLVRVADATGIPLDAPTHAGSAGFRQELGLDAFSGARNTP